MRRNWQRDPERGLWLPDQRVNRYAPRAPEWGGALGPRRAVAAAGGGATIDAGFPLTSTGATSSVSVTTPGPNRLLVAVIVDDNSGGVESFPYSVSGGGLTWTRIASATLLSSYINYSGTEIWAAWASSAITSQTITATPVHASTNKCVAVYSIAGAKDGSSSISNSIRATPPAHDQNAVQVSLTSTVAGSLAIGGVDNSNGDSSTVVAATDNVVDVSYDYPSWCNLAVIRYTGAVGGTITVGGSQLGLPGGSVYRNVAAVEVLAA